MLFRVLGPLEVVGGPDRRTPGPDRVMTCMQPGVRHRWRLVPEGDATRVQAHVEIPDHRRELIDGYRVKIPASLERLTALVTAP